MHFSPSYIRYYKLHVLNHTYIYWVIVYVYFECGAEEDLSIPAIKILHIGEESYFNMWQKVRNIWKYICTHYINEFDWFLLGKYTYIHIYTCKYVCI